MAMMRGGVYRRRWYRDERRRLIPDPPAATGASLAGTINITGSESGTLTAPKPLVGTATGTATEAGALSAPKPLVGTDTGAATAAGALSVAKPLVGSITGAVTVSGNLRVTAPLSVLGWTVTFARVGAVRAPFAVARANDFSGTLSVRGIDSLDGSTQPYAGSDIDAFWAAAEDSDTPLGSVTARPSAMTTPGDFALSFDATDMAGVLAGLTDQTPVFLVVRTTGDFRVVRRYSFRTSLPLD
ncbi:MAG TPA: hypothetical protein VFN76_10095 [Candidatus Limnocylindria bacterium]|nr:hypothetical protein [Candidatus Limnocylindria bacterium]